MILSFSGEWMASCLQKVPSGIEFRARKEKMMKWVFQTLAKDRDWISVTFIFPQGYQKVWISMREQLLGTDIAYLFSSFLWNLKIKIWIIITYCKAMKYIIIIMLPSSKSIFSHFSKLMSQLNPLNAIPTKWPSTLKQFVGKLPMNCLSVFDHFVKLALKGLTPPFRKEINLLCKV